LSSLGHGSDSERAEQMLVQLAEFSHDEIQFACR